MRRCVNELLNTIFLISNISLNQLLIKNNDEFWRQKYTFPPCINISSRLFAAQLLCNLFICFICRDWQRCEIKPCVFPKMSVFLCIEWCRNERRGRLAEVAPTLRERRIDRIDLSPSLAVGSSSGLPWHCWLPRPRPPTATHPISSNRPASMQCSRALSSPIGWSSAHTHLWLAECCHPPVRVVSFVFLFFLFSFFLSSPCFTHTAERKGSQSEKKTTSTQPQRRQPLWHPPSLCSTLAFSTKKVTFSVSIPKCHRGNSPRWTRTR